jgi:hypothetical protein
LAATPAAVLPHRRPAMRLNAATGVVDYSRIRL